MKTASKKELRVALANLLHATNEIKHQKHDALWQARYDAQTALYKGKVELAEPAKTGAQVAAEANPDNDVGEEVVETPDEIDSGDLDNDKDLDIPFLRKKKS